jgi:thioredoxin-related protein
MKKLLYLLICLPVIVQGRQNQGIKFEQTSNWEQVKAKAKAENKYIFMDCYATWCGPCKKMEKTVFSNDTVSNYINSKFVAVKVQFDKTDKDNEQVKSWYADADTLKNKYKIAAIPRYLFFSSDGELVHSAEGFQETQDFITLAGMAIDPQKQYASLLENYREGKKDYSNMLPLIKAAEKMNETTLAHTIRLDYSNHLLNLKEEQLLKKDNVEFMAASVNSSKHKFFQFFFKKGRKIDAVMNKKEYAQKVVDKIIIKEEVAPVLETVPAEASPDWSKLHAIIKSKYNNDYADRNILQGKLDWYQKTQNIPEFTRYFIQQVEKYGTDTTDATVDGSLNYVAYVLIFGRSSDPTQIDAAIKWMEGVIRRYPADYLLLDTLANLLYKKGKKNEALLLEEKALQLAIEGDPEVIKIYQDVINKIKKGEPTWPI